LEAEQVQPSFGDGQAIHQQARVLPIVLGCVGCMALAVGFRRGFGPLSPGQNLSSNVVPILLLIVFSLILLSRQVVAYPRRHAE
jgi:hypothetical protein